MATRGRVCANAGVAHRTNALRRVILLNVLTVTHRNGTRQSGTAIWLYHTPIVRAPLASDGDFGRRLLRTCRRLLGPNKC